MAGNKAGGLKVARANKARYGQDYYIKLGSLGGSAPKKFPCGFAARPDIASAGGRIGGIVSRRRSAVPKSKRYYELKEIDNRELELAYAHLLQVQRKAQHDREVVDL